MSHCHDPLEDQDDEEHKPSRERRGKNSPRQAPIDRIAGQKIKADRGANRQAGKQKQPSRDDHKGGNFCCRFQPVPAYQAAGRDTGVMRANAGA